MVATNEDHSSHARHAVKTANVDGKARPPESIIHSYQLYVRFLCQSALCASCDGCPRKTCKEAANYVRGQVRTLEEARDRPVRNI